MVIISSINFETLPTKPRYQKGFVKSAGVWAGGVGEFDDLGEDEEGEENAYWLIDEYNDPAWDSISDEESNEEADEDFVEEYDEVYGDRSTISGSVPSHQHTFVSSKCCFPWSRRSCSLLG